MQELRIIIMLKIKFVLFSFLYLFGINNTFAQNVASLIEKKIIWTENKDSESPIIQNFTLYFNRKKAPTISENFETKTKQKLIFTDFIYSAYTGSEKYKNAIIVFLKNNIEPKVYHTMEGNVGFTGYIICPFKLENGLLYQLVNFKYTTLEGENFTDPKLNSAKRAVSNSVLASGEWFKFSVTQDGMYKIDANLLQKAGININFINPKTLKLYSHQGGMLSEINSDFRYEDLPENAIQVIGENDNQFNGGDYIIFYAQSPHKWFFSTSKNRYVHVTNTYSDKTYLFLTFGGTNGKRMDTKADGNTLTANASYNTFDYFTYQEKESENFCKEGRKWFGQKFDNILNYAFTHSIDNIDLSKPLSVYYDAVTISPASSKINLKINNTIASSQNFSPFPIGDDYLCYINSDNIGFASQNVSSSNVQLNFEYQKITADSKAWLDYYELFATRQLKFSEGFMPFRNTKSFLNVVAEYRLSNLPSSFQIMDVSNPVDVKIQNTFNDNGEIVFRNITNNKTLEYALNDGNASFPFFEGKVVNQNLHATGNVQFIIVSHPDFLDAANKLADFHRTRDLMDVLVTTQQAIYNEFSSGSQDISAIRDFFKLIYYNNTNPQNNLKYAMFMGDGSFDYKDIIKNNTNFVPLYESSFDSDNYCSDDFFGFLDPLDGEWFNEQKLEIPVTRLPANSAAEAMGMVDKIINYKADVSLGDWRNAVTFCADDFDKPGFWEKIFVSDFEDIYNRLDANYKNLNVRKIYADAYKQDNLGGSQRYPDVQVAINKEFEKGTLIFNYIGHGGTNYLADEKIFDVSAINKLTNKNSLPVFFTATCEFSKYDDATYKSAGEYVMTNPNGGAVAMFTTVRVVGASDNAEITKYFWSDCAFVKIGGKWPTLGDIYKKLKNRPNQTANDRRFILFADPALIMNYPEHIVKIDTLNDNLISAGNDTIKALSKVTFAGHIENVSGNFMSTFNGRLSPTIYDKYSLLSTLGNDAYGYKTTYKEYSNILYKGKTSVNSGRFKFSFIVPKDIAYNYGFGKVSLYAEDKVKNTDASGNLANLIVGGSSSSNASDVKGPEIELYVDDYSFVDGGLTDKTPLLLAKVIDENGINASGSGIGRDIMAYIDKGTINEKSFVLNSFYSANLNSYTSGEINYQLENIADGRHTYTLKVWDVFNNPSETTIEFVVANDDKLQLQHVLNYPNPFSTQTTFHFDHNRAGQNLNIILSIQTITGTIIKTIEQFVPSAPGHVADITWGGRDEFDNKLAKGVYIYRIIVRTDDGQTTEKIEKLVILN